MTHHSPVATAHLGRQGIWILSREILNVDAVDNSGPPVVKERLQNVDLHGFLGLSQEIGGH